MKASNYDFLKSNVLTYLESVKVNTREYRFTKDGEANIYSSVIALYILDIFDEIKNLSESERKDWVAYIQKFQNSKTGCFEPDTKLDARKERNVLQLTTFCYSALGILGAEPLYDLPYKEELLNADFVDHFLHQEKCLKGARGSGNMAMFLGIFITAHYEKSNNPDYLNALEKWFDLHDAHANVNGFWGENLEALYFNGVQNGFHQYVIYYYWNRAIKKNAEIEKVVMDIQDTTGHFAPFIGGAACEDYDAVHLILILYRDARGNLPKQIRKALKKTYNALLKDLNEDGGFCQTKMKPNKFNIRGVLFLLRNANFSIFKIKLRKTLGFILRGRDKIVVNWFRTPRNIDESNLWDTWFKVLTLAEIEAFLNIENEFNFQEKIGLGHYIKDSSN